MSASDVHALQLIVFFSRALLLFCPLVSGYDSVHIRANIPRLEDSLKYGQSAGDKSVSHFYILALR